MVIPMTTEIPTDHKLLKVGDRVKYIGEDSNGIGMTYGMVGTIKALGALADSSTRHLHIIWDNYEKASCSLTFWWYKDRLLLSSTKPDYMAITRLIVRS